MNQEKIGRFLKQLRMEKQLTQEKLSETLGVSRRTVSRWETGNNLPDLSMLVELAEFYDVDLKEIFAGERNQNMMNEEEKDTLKQAAAYTEQRKKKIMRRMHILFIIGCISMACYLLILFFGPEQSTPLSDFFKGVSLGISAGMIVVGTIMTSSHADAIVAWKTDHGIIRSTTRQ